MEGMGYRNIWFSISKNCKYDKFYGFTQAVIYITYISPMTENLKLITLVTVKIKYLYDIFKLSFKS